MGKDKKEKDEWRTVKLRRPRKSKSSSSHQAKNSTKNPTDSPIKSTESQEASTIKEKSETTGQMRWASPTKLKPKRNPTLENWGRGKGKLVLRGNDWEVESWDNAPIGSVVSAETMEEIAWSSNNLDEYLNRRVLTPEDFEDAPTTSSDGPTPLPPSINGDLTSKQLKGINGIHP